MKFKHLNIVDNSMKAEYEFFITISGREFITNAHVDLFTKSSYYVFGGYPNEGDFYKTKVIELWNFVKYEEIEPTLVSDQYLDTLVIEHEEIGSILFRLEQ